MIPPMLPLAAVPTAAEQLVFLNNLQRLLADGLFSATYKFALLLALAELAVERGDDSGAPLVLPLTALSEKMIALYWRQVVPFIPADRGASSQVLKQITNGSAAILGMIEKARAQAPGVALWTLRHSKAWAPLVAKVGRVVANQPLGKLQAIEGTYVPFLYDHDLSRGGEEVILKPGVAFCLRAFLPLVRELVQAAWLRFVRRLPANRSVLGETQELGAFLFGTERTDLSDYRAGCQCATTTAAGRA